MITLTYRYFIVNSIYEILFTCKYINQNRWNMPPHTTVTTDFFAVNPFMASILLCDQLRICFKQPYVTLVLNSYLVRCLSASTSPNTSSVHNFVQTHSMLKLAFCNKKFGMKFVCFHSFCLFLCLT